MSVRFSVKFFFVEITSILFLVNVPNALYVWINRDPLPDIFDFNYDEDFLRNVTDLITSKGYAVENYCVQTKDGYLLLLQRLSSGRKNFKVKGKVVLFLHGLLGSSNTLVLNSADQSLGFILVDLGYDLWLLDNRGDTYSRQHIEYNPDMLKFWDFSFNEIGLYDLSAGIDFVLNLTGQQDLILIGHSQGTTAGFVLLSERPEYNKKVKRFIAMGPSAFVAHIKSPLKILAPLAPIAHILFYNFGIAEVLPQGPLTTLIARYVCGTPAKVLCESILFLLFGFDYPQLNQTRLPVYFSHFPSGASMKSFTHLFQLHNTKRFQKYDYYSENFVIYGQHSPPDYNLSKISSNVALLYSDGDFLADTEDVLRLAQLLPSVTLYKVPYPFFNHLDFVTAVNANTLVYDKIVELIRLS